MSTPFVHEGDRVGITARGVEACGGNRRAGDQGVVHEIRTDTTQRLIWVIWEYDAFASGPHAEAEMQKIGPLWI